ncbi:MAG: cytochrome c peroxidase [Saprospiraceae bacterium]|jgi:cytochrome c peroxidase
MKNLYIYLFCLLFAITFWGCEKDSTQETLNWTYNPSHYNLNYPDNFPIMIFDEDNPLTEEGIALGRMLYYDSLLHPTGELACATCHLQSNSFSSQPAVLPHINLGWNNTFLWNGKVSGNVEDIMLFEVEEFFKTDLDKFRNHETYPKLFYEAFGTEEVTSTDAAKALAQFVRTFISSDARYDRIMIPNGAIFPTEEELNGLEIFYTEKGDCFHCHGGILFTDNLFHNNGLDLIPSAHGLSEITGDPLDLGKYKTPTLRNIEMTAPYMHDGRYQTLEEVIDFYSDGVQTSATIDPLMKQAFHGGINLNQQEKSDLRAFLKILTDTTFTNNPAFSSPF